MEEFKLNLDNNVDKVSSSRPVGRKGASKQTQPVEEDNQFVSCLSNQMVTVKFVPNLRGNFTNPKHEYYGGMASGSFRMYTVPINQFNGAYVQVLSDSEQRFLEEVMGLEYNALSIHLKDNNYWDNVRVRVSKESTILNLADPVDFIKYKILLANKDEIAESLQVLQDMPKETYKFVLIKEGEEDKMSTKSINYTMQSYKLYGKYEDEYHTLKTIVELIEGRPISSRTKLEQIQGMINKHILQDAKKFVLVAGDELLKTKVLIKQSTEAGLISNRGNYLYLKETGQPLCEDGQEPTLSVAAAYLNHPKRQDVKFSLEAKLK